MHYVHTLFFYCCYKDGVEIDGEFHSSLSSQSGTVCDPVFIFLHKLCTFLPLHNSVISLSLCHTFTHTHTIKTIIIIIKIKMTIIITISK